VQGRRDHRLHPATANGANRPPGWNRWSAAEKVERLLGLSFDRMREYLAWTADGLDPYRLAAQAQVIRVVAMAVLSPDRVTGEGPVDLNDGY
jgi:hypothetical protein